MKEKFSIYNAEGQVEDPKTAEKMAREEGKYKKVMGIFPSSEKRKEKGLEAAEQIGENIEELYNQINNIKIHRISLGKNIIGKPAYIWYMDAEIDGKKVQFTHATDEGIVNVPHQDSVRIRPDYAAHIDGKTEKELIDKFRPVFNMEIEKYIESDKNQTK